MAEQDNHNKDGQDWLALLAGDDVDGVNEETRLEAEILRKTLLFNSKDKPNELDLKRSEKALLQRLKDEDLVVNKKNSFSPFKYSAIAASAAILAISINVVQNYQSIPSVSEGFSDITVYRTEKLQLSIVSNDPEKTADEFKRSLHKAGVLYRLTESDIGWFVEFYTKNTKDENIFKLMSKYNLKVDAHGWVRVMITNKDK